MTADYGRIVMGALLLAALVIFPAMGVIAWLGERPMRECKAGGNQWIRGAGCYAVDPNGFLKQVQTP